MKNTLYIIRGLPGSGKSTEAQRLLNTDPENFRWFEADMFFVDSITGEYKFDASFLKHAHEWCLFITEVALKQKFNVIVSNTFSTKREFRPYADLASKLKVPIDIRQMNGNYGSIHNVPEKTIEAMKNRWATYLS
jgi:hypothetical protein